MNKIKAKNIIMFLLAVICVAVLLYSLYQGLIIYIPQKQEQHRFDELRQIVSQYGEGSEEASIDFVLLTGVQIGLVVNSPHPTPIIANFQNWAIIENRSAHQTTEIDGFWNKAKTTTGKNLSLYQNARRRFISFSRVVIQSMTCSKVGILP